MEVSKANVEQIPITDLVLPESQVLDDYPKIRAKMGRNLSCSEKVNRYAVHESGHLIYLLRTGLISSVPDARYEGPTIYCEGDTIQYFMAAVTSNKVRLSDKTFVYTKDILDKLAYVAVAGTLVERALLGIDEETENASDGDKGTLFKHCYAALERDQIDFEGFTLWTDKYEEVKNESKGLSEADPLAQQLKKLVFMRCFGVS